MYDKCDSYDCEFTMDCNMVFNKVTNENIRTSTIKINGEVVELGGDEINVVDGDIIEVKITKINRLKPSLLCIEGYSPDVIYDRNDENVESDLDFKNLPHEIDVQ